MKKEITIVGGGLAGLTLGILLRRAGVPAVVFEAGNYPRHRVCGEFISGRGRAVLREAGIEKKILAAGGMEARDARFFVGSGATRLALPEPALCVSRYTLDALLAAEFCDLGGELRVNERVAKEGEGTVRATGRRPATAGGGRMFGLKAHARGVELAADLEMHLGPARYVGISRCEREVVNVCGLFYSEAAVPDLARRWREWLGASTCNESLKSAEWVEESHCAVAALSCAAIPQEAGEFSVGDAAAMIPPVTGNGMSMAFESAALAAPMLEIYSRGARSWVDVCNLYQRAWKQRFASRLRWAIRLQEQLFRPRAQRMLAHATRLVPALARVLFHKTR